MGWQFQYWNGSTWLPFSNVQIDHVLEELSGHEELVFTLLNTAANRSVVQGKPFVQALFNGSVIYPINGGKAILAAPQYSPTKITVTAYNYVFVQLSQASQTVTQNYTNTTVSTIAAYICGLAGVSVGSMPNLSVSIKFQDTNCFTALQNLAAACGCDYWGDSAFNIGTRDGTIQTLGYVGSNSKRGLDFSKQIDQVIIKGVDASGVQIEGSAGTPGGSIATFTDKKVADVATLNQLAAYKLQTLNNPSNGTSLECLINQVASWHPGQYISADRADLALEGSFIIKRLTKYAVTCSVEVDAAMPQMDILLQDTDQYADLGVYQAQPTTQTPTALTLQGLLHLYHLTEGSGTTANDSSPNGSPSNGTITNGYWINGAISGTKVLSFGGSGYVDCPNPDVLANSLAIGCWFSPSVLVDHGAMIGKNNNYLLEIVGLSGALRFGLHIGGSWVYLQTPNGTIAPGGRGFALAVYDGAKMYLYVANPQVLNQLLTYSQAQTGNLDSSSADGYLAGSGFKGVVAEIMLWGRALSSQEVQELFFRPLTRIVAKGSIAPPPVGPDYYLPLDRVGMTVIPKTSGSAIIPHLAESVKLTSNTVHETTFAESNVIINPDVDPNHAKTIHEAFSGITVTINPNVDPNGSKAIHDSIAESVSVTKAPTQWFITIFVMPDPTLTNDGYTCNQTLKTQLAVNAGTGLTVTITENVNGAYALKNFNLDGTLNNGTPGGSGSQYITTLNVAAQTAGTYHLLLINMETPSWKLSVSSTGPGTVDVTGDDLIPCSSNSRTYTGTVTVQNPPNHFDGWYLDGNKISTNLSCLVSAQAAGTSHALVAVFHVNGQ